MEIPSYPKIWNLGHPQLAELFYDDVIVEEKVDGSQFSFCIGTDGGLRFRSKSAVIYERAPDKMFAKAVEAVCAVRELLTPRWVYRAEYLKSPKHNALSYHRTPRNHLAIYDIMTGQEEYIGPSFKADEASALGFDVVPHLFSGRIQSPEQLAALLDRESFLGGAKIEGVVIKNYKRFGRDGKVLLGKHVSEDFKEVAKHEWKKSNPANKDMLSILMAEYRTSPRWAKAVHRLRDAGALENDPRDIGMLIKAIQNDITEECQEEIAAKLLRWALPNVLRGAVRGFPEWYKERLVESQFSGEAAAAPESPLPQASAVPADSSEA